MVYLIHDNWMVVDRDPNIQVLVEDCDVWADFHNLVMLHRMVWEVTDDGHLVGFDNQYGVQCVVFVVDVVNNQIRLLVEVVDDELAYNLILDNYDYLN